LIIGLAVALDRGIVDHAQAARAGQKRVAPSDARGMAGRTLGILGFDPSGVELARRARAFGMCVRAWSPTLTPESAEQHNVEFCNWPRELARGSDIVAVHTPPELGDEVLVDAEFLQSMRPGAHLIHVGRPGSIDQNALLEALERNDLRVACDVSAADASGETARCRTNLLQHPHMICTRGLAGDTRQARDAVAEAVVHTIRTFLLTGDVLGCVNVCERSPATWQLVLRVRDQVGVMAGILDAVRADGINAEEITSRVFLGAKAACCTIALDERPSTEALAAIRALPDVIYLDLRAVV
jgi:D-3-phosphoglycerate dehydrogenase